MNSGAKYIALVQGNHPRAQCRFADTGFQGNNHKGKPMPEKYGSAFRLHVRAVLSMAGNGAAEPARGLLMIAKQHAVTLVASLWICVLTGCEPETKSPQGQLDFGTVSGSTYSNKYFGLTITLPNGWTIQDHEAQRKLMKHGVEMLTGGDKNLQVMAKASELQTVSLLAAFAHPVGAPVAFNPSIACVAERLDQFPGIKRGSDYLFHVRKALEAGQIKVAFPKDVWSERLGGREFDVMPLEITAGATTVRQRYYALVHKGYALGCITSASTNHEELQLKPVMESVTFN